MDLKRLSDAALMGKLRELAADGRRNLRSFIEHLREFEDRGLAGGTKHATTFVYCTQELRLTEGEAYRRMQVAGLAARFPRVLDLIEQGGLNLTTASALAPHLNKSNFEELTAKAALMSQREVQFLVASIAPRPSPGDVVRPVSQAASIISTSPLDPGGASSLPPRLPVVQPQRVEPLSSDAARIHFTATRELLDKVERARALLRHKFPFADYNDIFDEALEALLMHRDPDRKATAAPKREVLPDRRRIPQWVKDEVWKRDCGRCAFVAVDGARCGETAWLEFDHVRPFAFGGRSDDVANVRLLCRAHNQRAARELFG